MSVMSVTKFIKQKQFQFISKMMGIDEIDINECTYTDITAFLHRINYTVYST